MDSNALLRDLLLACGKKVQVDSYEHVGRRIALRCGRGTGGVAWQ